jgi:DNA-binding CsgD family transcriptional regulator
LALVISLLSGEARGVVIAGAAGVGKTRLAQEALARRRGVGDGVEWVTATRSARALPFGAFLQLVGPEDLDPGGSPLLLYRKVREALKARGSVIIAVDDAHLLDEPAAELLGHLARSSSLRFLLTVRSGEPAPDAIGGLWCDSLLARVDLQPMARPEIAAMVEAALDGRLEEATVERLFDVTKGNVLFLREVIFDALSSGALRKEGGTWIWRPRGEVGARLVDVVLDRLGQLSQEIWGVLNVLAVGEPLSATDLEQLAPLASRSGLEAAEQAGCVVIEVRGLRREVRLTHPLYGEVVRARMTQGLADRIRGALATRVATVGGRRRGDLLRRALWTLEAGLPGEADLFRAAATQARSFDLDLMAGFAKAAVSADPSFDNRLLYAWAPGDAREHEQAARDLYAQAGSDSELARAADLVVFQRLLGSLDPWGALGVLEDAAARVSDPATRSVLHARRIQILLIVSETAAAIALAREVLASPAAAPAARLRAAGECSIALAMSGQASSAQKVCANERQVALDLVADEPILASQVMAAAVISALTGGDLPGARAGIGELQAMAAHNAFARTWELALRGRLALLRGEGSRAAALLSDAVIADREHPNAGMLWWVLALAAEAAALVGDKEGASRAVLELGVMADLDFGLPAPDIKRALGWVGVGVGALTVALETFVAAADRASGRGLTGIEVLALYDAVRVGAGAGVKERLLVAACQCEGPLPAMMAAHVRALQDGDAAGIEVASNGFEQAGYLVLAAETAVQAAVAFSKAGLRRREAEAVTRAHRLRSSVNPIRTPMLDAAAVPTSLTRREREVAHLAVEGLPSRAIADRLKVSVRTVDGHLYQVYTKLGVANRAALARALSDTEKNR